MKGKVGVGETLRRAFSLYRNQAGVLLPVAFWLFLGVGIVEALAGNSFGWFLLTTTVTLAVATLYQGMVVGLVRDIQDGRRDNSIGALVRSVAPVVLPLLGAGLIIGFGVGIGFVLFVVPGLYLLTIWAVAAPVIVVERRGIGDALGRSRRLVRGNGWRVLATLVLAFLILMVVSVGLALLAIAIVDSEILRVVFGALGSAVTAPIVALVSSVLYFRLLEIERSRPATSLSETSV